MKTLQIYGRMYATCVKEAFRGALKNAWTVLLPFALVLTFVVSGMLLGRAVGGSSGGAFVAGILYTLLRAALLSAYLYFVRETVMGSSVRLSELSSSFGAYFWSIINLFFVFWIVRFLLGMMLGNAAGQVLLALELVALIALNAAPEVMTFRGTHGGLDTIRTAFRFLQSNPLEWLLPNALLFGLIFLLWTSLVPRLSDVVSALVLGPAIHLAFLFRGHLFMALDGSSHRQRMFKYRYGG